jgi:hypothetical protein
VNVAGAGTDNVSATGGPAIDVTGTTTSNLDFDDVDSTNSANDGINLAGLGTGTFTATSGDIGGAAGIAFDLDGGSGTVTYPGNLNNGSGATADITNRTGGAVTLSGSIADTNDAGGGITLSGNTGGSTTFSNASKTLNTVAGNAVVMGSSDGHTLSFTNGGLDIDTTTGKGLEATTSGTLTVEGSNNTIDTGSGPALNVVDTDIGNNDLTFLRISANGAPNGIVLNNTANANGRLFVTGSGAAGTGGTIQGITNRGLSAINVPGGISIAYMNFTNAGTTNGADPTNAVGTCGDLITGSNTGCNAAIHLDAVNVATIDNVAISGGSQQGINGHDLTALTLTNSSVQNAGDQVREAGGNFQDLKGTATITNVNFSGNESDQLHIANSTATALTVNVTGTTSFQNSAAPNGHYGVLLEPTGTANMTFNVNGGTFFHNRSGGLYGKALNSSTLNVTITGGTWTGMAGVEVGSNDSAIEIDAANTSTVKALVQDIPTAMKGFQLNVIHSATFSPGSPNLDVTVQNVTIGDNSSATSASTTGAGIGLDVISTPHVKAKYAGNTIKGVATYGIVTQMGISTAATTVDVTIQSNNIAVTAATAFDGIHVRSGTQSGDQGTVCAQIGGAGAGNVSSSTAGDGLFVWQRFTTTVRLPGFPGGSAATFLQGNNPALGDTTTATGTFTGGAACATPSLPAAPNRPR